MLTAMKELPATLLLRPTGMETLATRLWSQTGIGAYAAAAPYAVALVLLAVVPTALLLAAQRSSREDDEDAGQQRFGDEVLVVPEGGTS
jgi:iron(III) transport system permease protein